MSISYIFFSRFVNSCKFFNHIFFTKNFTTNHVCRFFVPPPPLPPTLEGRTIVSLFKEVLTKLPRNSGGLFMLSFNLYLSLYLLYLSLCICYLTLVDFSSCHFSTNLSKLSILDKLHDCINYYTTTAIDDYLSR